MEESDGEIVVRLRGAKLPCTPLEVNLTATIRRAILGRRLELEFESAGVEPCRFRMEAPFDAWVRGEAEAACLPSESELRRFFGGRLHARFGLHAKSSGHLSFRPDGAFVLADGRFRAEGPMGEVALAELLLRPEAAGRHESSARSNAVRLTRVRGRIEGPGKGRMRLAGSDGWSAQGSLRGLDRLEVELHSDEAAFAELAGDAASDWQARHEGGYRLRLEGPRLAWAQDRDTQTQALAARLHEEGAWISFPSVSLDVGPMGETAEALFVRQEDAESVREFADLQAGIRGASFSLDGAVTRARMASVEPLRLVGPEDAQAVRPGTIAPQRPGLQPAPAISRLDIQAITKFRLAPFQIEVVRREDMLALTFEFVNLSLNAGTGTVSRADATKPAYVAVIFPPQNLAEAHYQEDAKGLPALPVGNAGVRPIPSRLSGESRLVFWIPPTAPPIHFSLKGDDGKGRNGLLDWSKWKPSIVATAVSSFGAPRIKIDAAFANPIDSVSIKSRAIGGVLLPGGPIRPIRPPEEEDAGLVASLNRLAARRGPSAPPPSLPVQLQAPNATAQLGRLAPGIDPTVTFKFIPKARIEPNAMHTQLEMPVRLILSPNETAGWAHARTLPSGPRFTLWHTRLGVRFESTGGLEEIRLFSDDGKAFYRYGPEGAQGPFPVGSRSGPSVRAVDALDWMAPRGTAAAFPPVIPTVGSLQEYVINRQDRTMLVDSMCWRGEGASDTEPFEVENLMLTSLGGYLKGEWVWRRPATGWADDSKPALVSWRHVATLGRDQFIKLVYKGYLFPTGHKAVLIKIAERKFQIANGRVVAYMRSRRLVAIRDPLVTFNATEQRAIGYSSITCQTVQSPILDPFPGAYGSWGGVQTLDQIMLLYSGGKPVQFLMRAVDMDGNQATWGQPSVFVRSDRNSTDVATLNKIVAEWEKADGPNTLPQAGSKRSRMYGQKVAFAPGGGKNAAGEDTDGNTTYPVNDLMLSGKVNATPSWPFDQPRWKAVLHKANISAPAVQMMQGKPPTLNALHLPGESFDMEELWASMEAESAAYADDDGFDVTIPEIFKQNGFGAGNKPQMFLELVEKYAPKFGDTSKTGGIVNPDMAIQGLSKGKGPIGGALNDILNGNINPKDLLDQGARLLGAVKIFDIIPNPIKIDPGGSDAPYIELLMLYAEGKSKPPTGAKVSVIWKPPLKNWGFPNEPPLFYINNFKAPAPPFGGATGELKLEGSITTQFKGGGKPKMVFDGAIRNFRVDLIAPASFLMLDFKIIQFIAEAGKPFDTNVDLTKMTFTGPLTFIQKLQDLVNGGGDGMKVVSIDPDGSYTGSSILATKSETPGIDVYLDLDETGIRAGLKVTFPTVSVGMFAIRNISLGVHLILPFFGDPLTARFNFCERNNTFQIAVMGVTGGGFVAFTVNIDGNMTLEAAFEFGGSLSFDVGVASGGVSIMAGIYFRLDIVDDYKQCMIEAYIRLQGNLSVLGLIRVNLEFYLAMTYFSDGNRLVGTATLTVEIEILFFSISVSVTVQRQLAGEKSTESFLYASAGAAAALPQQTDTVKFTEAVSQTQWVQFCEAFA
jgi:hypothetical protein